MADRKDLLQILISDLSSIEKPVRLMLYNVLRPQESDGLFSSKNYESTFRIWLAS